MILNATTKSLEVLLAGAVATAQPVWVSAWADHTATGFTPGASDGLMNGATAVTAVAAPASDAQRQVKFFSLFNNDTASVTATVRVNNNGTFRILVKITLGVGETLEWDPANGWKAISTSGGIKGSISPAGAVGEVQFNGGGSLASDPDFLWDTGSNELRFGSAAKARMTGQNRFRYLNSMARVWRSPNQTLTTGTEAAVGFDNETFDTDNLHDNATNNTRLTAAYDGKYRVTGLARFTGNATGGRYIYIKKNNATAFNLIEFATVPNSGVLSMLVTDLVQMVAGDYVELIAFQSSGGNLDLIGASTNLSFSMEYVGE